MARVHLTPIAMKLKRAVSLRVLVVEHHGDLATALWRFLKSMGHLVEVAASLRTARAALEKEPFDVLLTDVNLPGGLCFFLFQKGASPLPRFVATMSAYDLEPEVRAAYPCIRQHLRKLFLAEEVEELFAGFEEEVVAADLAPA